MRKRYHSQFNLNAPFINLSNDIKHWWYNKDWRERKKINETATKIVFAIFIIVALVYGANKIIAYEVNEIRLDRLETMRLEREAVEREQRMQITLQANLLREAEENKKIKDRLDAKRIENNYIAKQIKKQYPIGTYIKVNNEWIGKVKKIDGNRIITTDGWQCYVSEDEIKYSEWKEYDQFIKENSKG